MRQSLLASCLLALQSNCSPGRALCQDWTNVLSSSVNKKCADYRRGYIGYWILNSPSFSTYTCLHRKHTYELDRKMLMEIQFLWPLRGSPYPLHQHLTIYRKRLISMLALNAANIWDLGLTFEIYPGESWRQGRLDRPDEWTIGKWWCHLCRTSTWW